MPNNPIRVLHILQRMEAGGTQALLMNLYRNIDRNKIQFDFFLMNPDKEFYDDEILKLGGRIYYNSIRKDFNILKFEKSLKRVLTNNPEYQIVHVHTYAIGYFCLKVAKKCGVPVRIAHSHNNETVHDWKYIPKLILQKLYTIYATDLMACSDDAGKYLFGNKKFDVLKNAIDSEKFVFSSDIREKQIIELNLQNKFVIGNVGRLHPQKNQKFLIDVFEKIIKIKPNACLLIVGSGPLELELKEYVKTKDLEDSVVFLGVRKNVNEIIQALDVFVLPSLFEGLGIVAIESQAAGTPIVASLGVPRETEITPLITRLSLSETNDKWANAIINAADNPYGHSNTQSHIKECGYDLHNTVNFIQNYYIERQRK